MTSEVFTINAPEIWDGFHNFGLHWETEFMKFYFDGDLVLTISDRNLIPQTEHMPRLVSNLASWVNGGPNDDDWPAVYEVDWIRMYKTGLEFPNSVKL